MTDTPPPPNEPPQKVLVVLDVNEVDEDADPLRRVYRAMLAATLNVPNYPRAELERETAEGCRPHVCTCLVIEDCTIFIFAIECGSGEDKHYHIRVATDPLLRLDSDGAAAAARAVKAHWLQEKPVRDALRQRERNVHSARCN